MMSEPLATPTSATPSQVLFRRLCLLGSLGLLGGSALTSLPASAQSEAEASEPLPAATVAPPATVETSAEHLLQPQHLAPASDLTEGGAASPPAPSAATGADTRPSVAPVPAAVENRSPDSLSTDIIDSTDYSLGATQAPDAPTVVFSDRSTGCRLVLNPGDATPSRTCAPVRTASNQPGTVGAGSGASSEGGFTVGPVTVGSQGVAVGGTTVISREFFNQRLRPLNLLRQGAQEFVFPLAIPAPITSLFGWRNHPIFGDRRFHTGTDLAAPEGTPVVATKAGVVSVAEYLGGYGLTVILHHDSGQQETRYAHLSRILVQPGEAVDQGDVIGLVGSTGNSTGPHLHFELRELTAQGWMLVDPDQLMNATVVNLVQLLNQPLQTLGMAADDEAATKATEEAAAASKSWPYRPAQPNAS